MKKQLVLLILLSIFYIGCEKENPTKNNDTTEQPPVIKDTTVFVTSDVNAGDIYFNINLNDTVVSAGDWDIKFSLVAVPGAPAGTTMPAILLNTSKGIKGSLTDTVTFDNLDPTKLSNYASDSPSSYVIGTKFLSYNPATHTLSVDTTKVYAVKLSGTKFAKFIIKSYTSGKIGIKLQIYEKVFTFTTSNVKLTPSYFSFRLNDTTSSTGPWDIKLTTVFAPDDSLRQFASPGIVLNSAANVTGTYVDIAYETVNAAAVTGLTKDKVDTLVTDSTRSVKSMPVYYSFDKRDTTTVDGNWDVKLTVNAMNEPLIVLNKNKGVTGKVLDNTVFSTYNAAFAANLESDVNDTTLVIGNKCFLYAGPPTHKLNPIADRTFVVRTINGARVKFQMLNYYSAAGVSGFMKFKFSAPEQYSIGSFCLKYAGPPTHKLNPYPDRTFVVNTSTGERAKFKMLTYYSEAGVSGFMKFQYEVK